MSFFEWLKSLFAPEKKELPSAAPNRAPAVSNPPVSNPAPSSPPPVPDPRSTTLNLEAGEFLPITRDELKEAAKQVRLGGAWFGRRDLIPPAEDLRTKLIDRAMVTRGLLTPEQLTEIHQVGAEMDRVRPLLETLEGQAALAGEAAVQAERQRQAELKKRKKEETAQRKRHRAEAIAHRRANDIVFLGRGVSGRLGERTSDAAKLAGWGLPLMSTPSDVASALALSIPRLRWLAFHTEVASRVHYVRFTVPKKSGGTRTLHAPHRTLAVAQRWIFDHILRRLPVESAAHGFHAGRSILSNAQQHVGRTVVVNLDLQDFFPGITFPRVRAVFHRLGYSPAVATILALLCTECPRRVVSYASQTYHVAVGPRGLPQGACTSPALSNQVARRLDRRLHGLANKLGLSYTRYADDLTFSGDESSRGRVGYLMARVRHIAAEEGYLTNEKKTRVLRRNTAQMVTGLVVNERPSVRRREVRRLRAILHRARTEGLERQNREGKPNFVAWLQGKISFVRMARPDLGDKFLAQLRQLLQSGLR